MAMYLLKPHSHEEKPDPAKASRWAAPLIRVQQGFESRFEKIREDYRNLLAMAMDYKKLFVIGFIVIVLASMLLTPFLGQNFFPAVDFGQITLHVRPPVGTRIEAASAEFGDIEARHPPGHPAARGVGDRR